MPSVSEWMLHTLIGGGLLLLLTAALMSWTRQPARRQRLGEWGLTAALLLAGLRLAPAWLVVPVPILPTASERPATPEDAAVTPSADDVWLTDGSGTRAAVVEEPATPPTVGAAPPSAPATEGRLLERLPELAPTLYFSLAGALALHWLLGCVALARILRTAEPAPASVLADCAALIRNRPLPRLLVSSRVATPFCCGMCRPTIVLPASLVSQGDRSALRWALAHEWTHLERGDARSGWLFGLGRAIFFPLPWFWWMRRQVRLCQEYVADAAASAAERPEEYAQFLLNWASAPAVPAAAHGVIGRSSDLLRRIAMLLETKDRVERRCGRRWSVLTACGLFALGALGGGVGLQALAAPAPDKVEAKKAETPPPAKSDAKPDGKAGAAPNDRPQFHRFAFPQGALPPEFEEFFKDFEFDPANPEALQQRIARIQERMQRMLERRGGVVGEPFVPVRPPQPRLGVKVEQPSPAMADQLDLPQDQGLVLMEVLPDSAAAKVGLKPHDILLEVAGKPVSRNVEDFLKMLAECKPDTPVDVVVLRKGKKETLKGLTMPEVKEQRVERPMLPRVPDLLRNRPFEARVGVAGQKPVATTIVRNNDEFTAKHREGDMTLVVTGKMADGKANVTGIDLSENGQKQHFANLDQVPAAHREKVQKLIELAQQGTE